MSGVFSNPNVLRERPNNGDLLGYSQEIDRVEGRVVSAVKNNDSVIIAYLGAFGVGKSTVLREVRKRLKNYTWAEFQTWRYSNRNELWDAFVIKMVSKLSNNTKDEWDIADEVDGGGLTKREARLLTFWIVAIGAILTGASALLWAWFNRTGQFWEAYLKYAVPVIFPLLLLGGLTRLFQLNRITDKRPLKRVFQLESLLSYSLSKMKRPLVVVIEDVDRSGDGGSIFMETLHEFLDGRTTNQPIILIAPQSNNSFDALDTDRTRGIEHALKVYDEKMYFNAKMTHSSADVFYSGLNFNKKYQPYKSAMIEITKELVYYYQAGQLTVRMLKHALREVDWFMGSFPNHNPAVALVFAVARMVNGRDLAKLAVRQLAGSYSLKHYQAHDNVPDVYVIDRENVFGVCLAMAAGAIGTAKEVKLVDSAGKFNQQSPIRFIYTDLNNNRDYVEKLDNEGSKIQAHLRKEYEEQLVI